MKRMSDLKDNLRGIKCDATKEAFRYLKKQGRKPRIDEVTGIYYIRVHIDGQRYDYYPNTGMWAPTKLRGKPGRWKSVSCPADFYSQACEASAIRNSDDATEKQRAFIDALLEQTGATPTEGAKESKHGAIEEIDRLLRIKASQKSGFYRKPTEPAREKPRMTRNDQLAYVSVMRFLSAGQAWTAKKVAFCCGISADEAEASILHLMKHGIIPLGGGDFSILKDHSELH